MNTNFEEVRDVVKDIIERRTINCELGIKDDFIKIVFSIRYLLSLNGDQIVTIWNGIRINEKLTDFILDATREFLLRAFSKEFTFEQLCIEIAEAHSNINSNNTAIDFEITKSIVSKNEIMKGFSNNPWLVLLMICEMIIVMENDNV